MPLRKIVKSTVVVVSGKSASGSEFGDKATLSLLDSGDVVLSYPSFLNDMQIDMAALLTNLKKSRTKSLEEAATILEIIESLERES
jgi:hypothetical protein